MAQTPNTSSLHPGVRRSVTLPPALQNNNGRGSKSSDLADAGYEALFSLPMARTMSFSAPAGTGMGTGSSNPEVAGTIPWTSTIENLEAAAPLELYRVPGSCCFVKSGGLLLSLMPRSQCWCVDGVSKFAIKVRDMIYRIELPAETVEEMRRVEEFRLVLDRILFYEKTRCPFTRGFGKNVTEATPVTPKRTRILAAATDEASPVLKRSAGSARRARKWEFDEVWRPEGYVKQSPSASPQPGLEESDGENSSSQEPEDGAFSRKTSTTSRTDTEPSSPVRATRPEKSRSVTAPVGIFAKRLSNQGRPEEVEDERDVQDPHPQNALQSPIFSQPADSNVQTEPTPESETEQDLQTEQTSSVGTSEVYAYEPIVPPMVSALQQRDMQGDSLSEGSLNNAAAEVQPTGQGDSDHEVSRDTIESAVTSEESFFTSQSATSVSSFHTLPSSPKPVKPVSDPATVLIQKESPHAQLSQGSSRMTWPPVSFDIANTDPVNPDRLRESQNLPSKLPETTAISPGTSPIEPPLPSTPLSTKDDLPPIDTATPSINPTSPISPNTPKPPSPPLPASDPPTDSSQPAIPLSSTPPSIRHSRTLGAIPERRTSSPLSQYPYYTGRRSSSPSTDLTNSLVSKTCALLLGPPSGLVAIMMQIAARVASGAIRTSRAFRVKDGKLGHVPGQWDDSDRDSVDEGDEDEAERKRREEEDEISSESDLFDDDDDSRSVSLSPDSPSRARRRRWNSQLDEEELD